MRGSTAIKRLPSEVLADIFIACRDLNEIRGMPNLSPWNLSRVCRLWRQTAVSHSSLWSSIYIGVDAEADDEADVYDPPLDILKCWLDRSAMRQLTVTLVSDTNGFPLPPTSVHQPLLESVSRAKAIYLCTSYLSTAPSLSVSPSNCPLLREFSWSGGLARYHSLPLPWAQLRHLAISHHDMVLTCDQCQDILNEANNLVSFELEAKFICNEGDFVLSRRQLRSSSIREFKFTTSLVSLGELCRHAKLPALEDLSLVVEKPRHYVELEEGLLIPPILRLLEGFIDDIQSGLKSLALDSLRLAPFQLSRLLNHSPSLVHLRVSSLPLISDDVLLAMTVQGTGVDVLCPHLSTLTLDHCLKAKEGALAAMVESRAVVSPLSRVSVKGELLREHFGDDLKHLEDLRTSQPSLRIDWVTVDSDDSYVLSHRRMGLLDPLYLFSTYLHK